MRSGNPALTAKTFISLPKATDGNTMTLDGTVNKTGILLLILSGASYFSFQLQLTKGLALLLPTLLVALLIGIAISFKKNWAPYLAPIYALVEGCALGTISAIYETKFEGIVFQAVMGTAGTLFALLAAYRSGWIQPTENLKLGIVAGTGGLALLYLVDLIWSFMGGGGFSFIRSSSPIGIAFSIFAVGIAAFNLVLDFDFIETGAKNGAPKYMEWYGAFGLMVTLVWLYLEVLRLLSKTRSRN